MICTLNEPNLKPGFISTPHWTSASALVNILVFTLIGSENLRLLEKLGILGKFLISKLSLKSELKMSWTVVMILFSEIRNIVENWFEESTRCSWKRLEVGINIPSHNGNLFFVEPGIYMIMKPGKIYTLVSLMPWWFYCQVFNAGAHSQVLCIICMENVIYFENAHCINHRVRFGQLCEAFCSNKNNLHVM